MVRALVSIGYTSGVWSSNGPASAARSLIQKISSELPRYYLPAASGAHSRHYMPLGKLKSNTEQRGLVFDTWVRVRDELVVTWEGLDLDKSEISILTSLVENLNYLGRSESWVSGRIVGSDEAVPEANCFAEDGKGQDQNLEMVTLLAPVSASDYTEWRKQELEGGGPQTPRKRARSSPPSQHASSKDYPVDLLDCLQKDTAWLRKRGWSRPPGSRHAFYWRPLNAITVTAPTARSPTVDERRFRAMLLSVASANRNNHALPPVTRTVPQAELLHKRLVGIASKDNSPPPELTGSDKDHKPLQTSHAHAHIIPLDLDADNHLEHILIWAPMGLGTSAQKAIRAARKTFARGSGELRLSLVAAGDTGDLKSLSDPYGRNISRLLCTGTVWESATPFVPPRHTKASGKNTLEQQIQTELSSRGFVGDVKVRQLAPTPDGQSNVNATPWSRFRHFQLSRQRGPAPPILCGFAIRLEFECPVTGPIAIGYGSHFGLGLFRCT